MEKRGVDYDETEYDCGHGIYEVIYFVNLRGYCIGIRGHDKMEVPLMYDKKKASAICKSMNERKPEYWEGYWP